MNKADREYIEDLVKELEELKWEIDEKAFRSDLEKQRVLREMGAKFITGRHVKREFILLIKPVEEIMGKLEAMLEEDFNKKSKELLEEEEKEEE